MKILVRRTGGFAGINDTLHDVDTSKLQGPLAADLERLALALESTHRAHDLADRPVGADLFNFEISLTDKLGQRTIIIPDDGSDVVVLAHELMDGLSTVAPR